MPQQKISEKNEEVFIDFEGEARKTIPRVRIEEEYYPAISTKIELTKMANYKNPNQIDTKLVWTWQIQIEGKPELAMFVTPTISRAAKGGKGYSNSKLYDILDACGLLEKAKQEQETLKTTDGLRLFLNKEFANRACKVEVKTVNKGTENAYSRVANVKKFI